MTSGPIPSPGMTAMWKLSFARMDVFLQNRGAGTISPRVTGARRFSAMAAVADRDAKARFIEGKTMSAVKQFDNVVDGKRTQARDGQHVDVVCPSDGKIFARIARSGEAEIDAAVAAARARVRRRVGAHDGARTRAAADETRRGDPRQPGGTGAAGERATPASRSSKATPTSSRPRATSSSTAPAPTRFMARRSRSSTAIRSRCFTSRMASPATSFRGTIRRRFLDARSRPRSAMGNACVVKPAEDAGLTPIRFARAGAGGRLSARRTQYRRRASAAKPAPRSRASRHRLHVVHRKPRGRHA